MKVTKNIDNYCLDYHDSYLYKEWLLKFLAWNFMLFLSRNVLPNNQIEMSYTDTSKSSTGFRFRSLITVFCARLLGIF